MKKIPVDPSTLPPIIWLRHADTPHVVSLVLAISQAGFIIADRYALVAVPLMEIIRYEHSKDRKTWKPCWREVQ